MPQHVALIIAYDTQHFRPCVGRHARCSSDDKGTWVLAGWHSPGWHSSWVRWSPSAGLISDPPGVRSAWGQEEMA